MILNPVESSMIARVGFDPDWRLLRAVMRDGSAYEVRDCFADEFAAFMASPSKGRHWHQVFAGRATKSQTDEGKESAEQDQSTGEVGQNSSPVLGLREPVRMPLDTMEPDKCCAGALIKALRDGISADTWTCSKCGVDWKPRIVDSVRHWEPQALISIFQRRPR